MLQVCKVVVMNMTLLVKNYGETQIFCYLRLLQTLVVGTQVEELLFATSLSHLLIVNLFKIDNSNL